MFIPVTYKNYAIPLMHVNFIQYAIPSAIFYIPYLAAMVLVGANLKEFEDVAKSHGWSKMNVMEQFQFILTSLLCVITVVVLIYFAVITCRKMKELKAKQDLEDRLNQEDNIDDEEINNKHLSTENQ